MIHPSDLLRSDSRLREFAAPLSLQEGVENDWGLSIFPCLAKLFNWRTFAKPHVFITLLSLIGCIQGLLLYYFRNTSQIWAKQYHIPKETADSLIYINEFFVGILALPISYWATVSHKIIWMSSLTICHGVFAMFLSIPERFFANFESISNFTEQLCSTPNQNIEEGINYSALSFLVIYQIFSATSSVAFFSIGLVYADDNSPKNKAAVLAIALASRQFGQQLGIYASWIPRFFRSQDIFRTYVWQGASILYVILGVSAAMFPRMLPSLLIKKLATSLFEFASGNTINEISTKNEGLLAILKRILWNKIIILSIISTVSIQTALINFGIFDHYFKQSRFYIADDFDRTGYNNTSFSINLLTNLIEQPFTILCILFTGYSISRTKIKIKYLVLWNIVTFAVGTLLFSTYLFARCDYEIMEQFVPSCSVNCGCSMEETFHPVCLKGRTYYSPCHAGCKNMEQLDSYKFYGDCSCAAFEETASDGSCHSDKCNMVYQLTQVNNIIAGGILATSYITTIVIILTSVKRIDKSISLGLEMTLLSLVPFLPARLGYEYIARKLCRYQYGGKCAIYSEKFSSFLSNTTVFLMLLGNIIHMFLLCTDLDVPTKNHVDAEISTENEASIGNSEETGQLFPMIPLEQTIEDAANVSLPRFQRRQRFGSKQDFPEYTRKNFSVNSVDHDENEESLNHLVEAVTDSMIPGVRENDKRCDINSNMLESHF